ncbi:hypothetical protein [Jiangella alba]|uniref:Uncharacterized protein n=1 Tax=Jiangella alba TaxID=561176 RepID=A0A1H5HZE0_9ACTN|nr:hypothetical protein [Jiangella alba]SEE33307.1 hypothetical protein SAMN04488561_1012 [Jiangella alba]
MSSDDDGKVFDGYARLYGPLTVAGLGLIFKPMFDDLRVDVETGGVESRFGNLWETAANHNGDPAVLGIMLALILMSLTLVATFRPRSGGLPVGIAVVCLLIIIMLITKPGTGDPAPDLSPDGLSSMAVAVFALVLGVVHAVHFTRWSRGRTPSALR